MSDTEIKTAETISNVVVTTKDFVTLMNTDPTACLKVENIALKRALTEKDAEIEKLNVKLSVPEVGQEEIDELKGQIEFYKKHYEEDKEIISKLKGEIADVCERRGAIQTALRNRMNKIGVLEARLIEFQKRYPHENVEAYDGVKAVGNGPNE